MIRGETRQYPGPGGIAVDDSESETDSPRTPSSTSSISHPSPVDSGHRNRRVSPHNAKASSSKSTSSDAPPVTSHWISKRHLTAGNPSPPPPNSLPASSWRNKQSVKSFHGALVICLNTVVDPPDIIKTVPCAVLETWVDPRSISSRKASEIIGSNLSRQFEGLNNRMKFKAYTDPSIDDMEKHCVSLRRIAKNDRTLFYYNGHGVPKPTPSGELWVFNKDYSQYIPISIITLQGWLGSPTIYVWDCSAAGNLLTNFIASAERRDAHISSQHQRYGISQRPYMDCIQMAACLADEQLPMCPELPADLFTSCLTSPIDMALRYFIMTHQLPITVTVDMISKIPGDLKDRRTPLGELNWILTSITDTIAWTTFPRHLFQRLYRSDLMIAALFRNFLLAERIMKNYRCTPHTFPPLPPTNTHPMWASWDMAIDNCLKQIPDLIKMDGDGNVGGGYEYKSSEFFVQHLKAFNIWVGGHGTGHPKRALPMMSWSDDDVAGTALQPPSFDASGPSINISPASSVVLSNPKSSMAPRLSPDELPIILQVLLSNTYRVQALFLICQFMDLGPWAVHLALLIGVFPYVQRLLQAPNQDLRAPLIFIWARIIAVDETCAVDLFGYAGWQYFAHVLALDYQRDLPSTPGGGAILPNPTEHRAMCLFILAEVCRTSPSPLTAQIALAFPPPNSTISVFSAAFESLDESDYLLKQWSALALAQIWAENDEIKGLAVELAIQDKLVAMLGQDKSPEVRAACLYAIGTFFGAAASEGRIGGGGLGSMLKYDEFTLLRIEITLITGCTLTAKYDMSPMVRKELVTLLSCAVSEYRGWFIVAAWVYWEEEHDLQGLHSESHQSAFNPESTRGAIYEWLERMGDDEDLSDMNRLLFSSIFTIFCILLDLSVDPYPEVSVAAQTVMDWVMACLLESPFARLPGSTLRMPLSSVGPPPTASASRPNTPRSRVVSLQSDNTSPSNSGSSHPPSPAMAHKPMPPQLQRSNTGLSTASRVSSTLKRTSSLANAFVHYAFPTVEETLHQGSSTPSPLNPRIVLNTAGEPSGSRPPSPRLNLFQYQAPYAAPSTLKPHAAQTPQSPATFDSEGNLEFSAFDCIEALIEEDWERLRARRSTRTRGDSHANGVELALNGGTEHPNPTAYHVEYDAYRSGLGTGSSIRDVLPFRSKFYEWSREYFVEPQMRQAETDEPGSVQYNKQMWRRTRNDKIIVETRGQALVASDCQWDRKVCSIQATQGAALHTAFHAFDTYILVSNQTRRVSVWDWSKRQKVQSFVNGNPTGTSITSLRWINEDIGGLIMTASSDGIVRLYRNHDSTYDEDPVELVTGFRALPDLLEVKRGAGLVTGWSQHDGALLVGGDSRKIVPWNAHHERSEREIVTGSESMITSLVLRPGHSQTFIASFGDGSMRLYDRRVDKSSPIVKMYSDHTAWIQSMKWQNGGFNNEIISASVDGKIKLWDSRGMKGCLQTWKPHPEGLSAFDLHEQTGVFASSSAIRAREWRKQTTLIRTISSDLPTPIGSVIQQTALHHAPHRPISHFHASQSSLAFHPNEMLLAIGGVDGSVKILGCNFGDLKDGPLGLLSGDGSGGYEGSGNER